MKAILLFNFLLFRCLVSFSQNGSDSLRLVTPIGHINWITTSKIRNDILFTTSDKTIKLWDLKSKKELKTFEPCSEVVFSMDVSLDGQFFATSHQKNFVIIQNVFREKEKKTIKLIDNESCEKLYFSCNDSIIIIPFYNSDLTKSIAVYNVKNLKKLQFVKTSLFDENFLFSHDRLRWFFQIDSNNIYSCHLEKGEVISDLMKFDFNITNFSYDNFKNEIIAYGKDIIEYVDVNNIENRIIKNTPLINENVELMLQEEKKLIDLNILIKVISQ